MYIQPSTVIKLLNNVPLDDTYTHTKSFSSASQQNSWFNGFVKYSRTALSYQRVDKAVVRVELPTESLYDCNYIMFQNTGFGNKWFYAFVTGVSYVNNETSDISYEIDVMQTWYFNYHFKPSWIEREHTATDVIGEHTVDENLNVGTMVIRTTETVDILNDISFVIAVTQRSDQESDTVLSGGLMCKNFNGLGYINCGNDVDLVNTWIGIYHSAGKIDAIQYIYCVPKELITETISMFRQPLAIKKYFIADTRPTSFQTYTPKNNKLLTKPYMYVNVCNNTGQNKQFAFEDFNTDYPYFEITGDINPDCTVYLFPMGYKNNTKVTDEGLTLRGYPMCSWVSDVYKTWLAQNQISNAVNIVGGVMATVGGIAMGNPLVAGGGALSIANTIGSFDKQSNIPDTIKGSVAGGGNLAVDLLNFTITQYYIKDEYAKQIDDYFTMFGYKVNKLKVPNLYTRPAFNYLKTIDCNIVGSVPTNDMKKIKENFDKGITFWHTSDIGNYELNNSV